MPFLIRCRSSFFHSVRCLFIGAILGGLLWTAYFEKSVARQQTATTILCLGAALWVYNCTCPFARSAWNKARNEEFRERRRQTRANP